MEFSAFELARVLREKIGIALLSSTFPTAKLFLKGSRLCLGKRPGVSELLGVFGSYRVEFFSCGVAQEFLYVEVTVLCGVALCVFHELFGHADVDLHRHTVSDIF